MELSRFFSCYVYSVSSLPLSSFFIYLFLVVDASSLVKLLEFPYSYSRTQLIQPWRELVNSRIKRRRNILVPNPGAIL